MSTEATRIRDAIFERLSPLTVSGGFKKVRMVPVAMLQPDDLPAITVSLLNERMTPIGDDNESGLTFDSEVTIGISVVRGGEMPGTLDQQADSDVDMIERLLLCDPTFTRFGPDQEFAEGDIRREPFFEAVTGITRRRSYPQSGETYFVEVRLEMNFRTSVDFKPAGFDDDLTSIEMSARPVGADPDSPDPKVRMTFPPAED